jgi:hypothetical protein
MISATKAPWSKSLTTALAEATTATHSVASDIDAAAK